MPEEVTVPNFFALCEKMASSMRSGSCWWLSGAKDAPIFKVRRLGEEPLQLPGSALLVGDIVLLAPDAIVPADCRLVEGSCLLDLSHLNGEPCPQKRCAGDEEVDDELTNGPVRATNMLPHGGRLVSIGGSSTEIVASVTAVGDQTVLAKLCEQAEASHVPEPLELMGLLGSKENVEKLQRSVAESSALGLSLRHESAFLVAGKVTAVVFDKTGVLSELSLGVAKAAHGSVGKESGRPLVVVQHAAQGSDFTPIPRDLIRAAALLSEGDSEADKAFRSFAKPSVSSAFGVEDLEAFCAACRVREVVPFNSSNKFQASVSDECGVALVRGAPDIILQRCTSIQLDATPPEAVELTPELSAQVQEAFLSFAKSSLRVIGVAQKPHDLKAEFVAEDAQELTFLGLLGLGFPLAAGVQQSVHRLQAMGIKIAVVSGDHPLTVSAIAKQAGIAAPDLEAVLGASVEDWGALAAVETPVAGRLTPDCKQTLVKELQKQGHVVCAVGDGLNDSPMLGVADLGVAVAHASPVTKSAANCLLTGNLQILAELLERAKSQSW